MEELSYVLTKNFLACAPFRFYFFHSLLFSLCWPLAFLVFSPPLWNSSPLFLITRSGSFSVMYVSVDIKNNVQKDSTLLWFFLSKSPGGHAISHKKHLELPVVSYPILHWIFCPIFYIGMPVVRTDGWAYGHVITKIFRMDGLSNFLRHGAGSLALGAPLNNTKITPWKWS